MAIITGTNPSGKMFDVVDEDGDVLGSFDHIDDAVACGRAAPWWAGLVNIRRDAAMRARQHAANMAAQRERILAFEYAA